MLDCGYTPDNEGGDNESNETAKCSPPVVEEDATKYADEKE